MKPISYTLGLSEYYAGNQQKIMKIMVIEDNLRLLANIEEILILEGHAVKTAVDGLDAMKIIANDPPDIIFCDVDLPRMDGNEVLLALKSDERFAQIPFYFMTAYLQKIDEHSRFQPEGIFIKPFKIEHLLQVCGIS